MMTIDVDFLRLQLDYTCWASERSILAARDLTVEELSRDLGDSYKGVFGTLLHIFQGDRIWLSRLRGAPRFTLADPGESWTLDSLGDAWSQVGRDYLEWLNGAGDVEARLQYKNLAGQSHSMPTWQIILHVVNHATYHRGQITTMLRQLGHTPLATDLHVFYMSR